MPARLIDRTPEAYRSPLLVKHLLHAPQALRRSTRRSSTATCVRYTYRDLVAAHRPARERPRRVWACSRGDTVGVMDWDSHRYLECFFAVPMMGAVLHTVNVRLSPEQILYTIDHAEDDVLLVNAEFLPVLEQIRGPPDHGQAVRPPQRPAEPPATSVPLVAEYEDLLARSGESLRLPRARRGHLRHDLLHDRDDRAAQGRVLQPPAARAAHPRRPLGDGHGARAGRLPPGRRLHADHADVPRARLGLPVHGDPHGRQAGLPGPLRPRRRCWA